MDRSLPEKMLGSNIASSAGKTPQSAISASTLQERIDRDKVGGPTVSTTISREPTVVARAELMAGDLGRQPPARSAHEVDAADTVTDREAAYARTDGYNIAGAVGNGDDAKLCRYWIIAI